MSWIKTVSPEEATGQLKQIYDETQAKFGEVINLVKIQSLRPETMGFGRELYKHLMTVPGGLKRLQRVLIATVVSSLNSCHYWVESHEQDLRDEIKDDAMVLQIQKDYTQVDLGPENRAMLDFAKKLTLSTKEMLKSDIEKLRENGFDDRDILDIAQLVGYFNYSNRVMDSLGIRPEPHMRYKIKE